MDKQEMFDKWIAMGEKLGLGAELITSIKEGYIKSCKDTWDCSPTEVVIKTSGNTDVDKMSEDEVRTLAKWLLEKDSPKKNMSDFFGTRMW